VLGDGLELRDPVFRFDLRAPISVLRLQLAAVRPVLPAPQCLRIFATGFTVLPVTTDIAWAAAAFSWPHRDPCDRQILAAAAPLGVPLVTADKAITAFAPGVGVKIVW